MDNLNEQPEPHERYGAIYILRAKNGTREFIKIGSTKEGIKKRMRKLQTGCPFKLIPYMRIEAPAKKILKIEKDIHKAMTKFQENGEWFRFNNESSIELTFRACLASHDNACTLFRHKDLDSMDPDYGGEELHVKYIINTYYSAKYRRIKGHYLHDETLLRLKEEVKKHQRKTIAS